MVCSSNNVVSKKGLTTRRVAYGMLVTDPSGGFSFSQEVDFQWGGDNTGRVLPTRLQPYSVLFSGIILQILLTRDLLNIDSRCSGS